MSLNTDCCSGVFLSAEWFCIRLPDGVLNDGMNRKYTLFKADSTPIKRHTKIKAIATPYAPK
ncbi:hypothetical protein LWM52_004442 [Escherichia coli]|nr:hypothetical protein [Escherichia coli]MEB7611310.1 hypothetical protein [Escherichia coli]